MGSEMCIRDRSKLLPGRSTGAARILPTVCASAVGQSRSSAQSKPSGNQSSAAPAGGASALSRVRDEECPGFQGLQSQPLSFTGDVRRAWCAERGCTVASAPNCLGSHRMARCNSRRPELKLTSNPTANLTTHLRSLVSGRGHCRATRSPKDSGNTEPRPPNRPQELAEASESGRLRRLDDWTCLLYTSPSPRDS